MDEIRKKQVVELLSKLNDMWLADFGHAYADFHFQGNTLVVVTCTRNARIALEMLLCNFQKMTVYTEGSFKLEILFY